MLEKIKEFIQNSKVAQFVLVLLLGIAIGAVFYPTKRIEEKLTQKHEEEMKSLKEVHSKELSKTQEQLDKTEKSSKEYHEETERKMSKMTSEIKTLQSKQKTAKYKIVRPDGTIEEKEFTESEVNESSQVVTQIQEEFKQKVDSIEQKWSEIHKKRVTELKKEFDSKEEQYKKTIDELQKSKVTEINKKSFGLEVGALIDKSFYGHITYDIFGPIFLGIHGEAPMPGSSSGITAGGGLGIRF